MTRTSSAAALLGEDGLHTTFNQASLRPAALDDEPEPAGDPDPHELGARSERIRRGDGPARVGRLLAIELRILAHVSSEPVCATRSSAARTSTRRRRPRCSARIRRR
jgi:hypothetical protein